MVLRAEILDNITITAALRDYAVLFWYRVFSKRELKDCADTVKLVCNCVCKGRHGWYGPERQLRRRRGTEQARYLDSEVPD